jgi:hypothetical protein
VSNPYRIGTLQTLARLLSTPTPPDPEQSMGNVWKNQDNGADLHVVTIR